VEANFHCIIKEASDRKKVGSALRGRMKKLLAVVVAVVVAVGVVGWWFLL
jgi:cell division septal protein FtsQ